MQAFTAVCMLLMTIVMFVVGIRLLFVARRTKQLPELLFGIAFTCGALGQGIGPAGQRILWVDPGTIATALNAVCFGLTTVGAMATSLAIWRIFRPEGAMGAVLGLSTGAAAIVGFALRGWVGGFDNGASLENAGMLVFQLARTIVFAWAAFEGFRYFGLLRRRLALGLAEPVAASQILFWAISATAVLATNVCLIVTIFALGVNPLDWPAVMGFIATCVALTGAFMWCAFFPPDFVRRIVESRLGATAAA